jgi:predicted regulator of Ras-like GTPase activity (Roadblock/LC7/MglB family)
MRITLVGLSLLALSAPGLAGAAAIAVPGDHPTIQEAVAAAQSGDVITVAKGTYAPFVVDDKTDLTIKGKGKPVVEGSVGTLTVIAILASQDVTLDGLVVQASTDRLVDIAGSTDVTVKRCTLTGAVDGIRAHDSANVLIEKNTFTDIENDAADLSSDDEDGPATTSRIAKNQFDGVGDDAIEIEGAGNVVEKNRVRNVVESGVALDSDAVGTLVTKNRIENTTETGIAVEGTGHTISKNTLKRVGTDDDEGIQLRGEDHVAEKNRLDDIGDDGIDVEGSNCQVRSNTVKNAGDSGVEVGETDTPGAAQGNLFERNKVTASGDNGFHVVDTGNTFTANKASNSGNLGLLDETVAGGNVYEKNKFGTEQIP